jgi:hypothetical protein
MLRKTILALAALTAVGVAALPSTEASAHWNRGWHHHYGWYHHGYRHVGWHRHYGWYHHRHWYRG